MQNKMLFIGGMGRSGTHYLGRIIGEHPQVRLRLEAKFTFWSITNHVAYNKKTNAVRFWLAAIFLKVLSSTSPRIVCEKTHPVIWVKSKLDRIFPKAKWICVRRDPYQSIASMKEHRGVQKWYHRIPLNEINPFLGITKENKSRFQALSLAEKGAYKWIAHMEQMKRIQYDSPKRVMTVEFDNLVMDQKETLAAVFNFLHLDPILPNERGDQSSLAKKNNLSKEESLLISQILIANNWGEWTKFSPF